MGCFSGEKELKRPGWEGKVGVRGPQRVRSRTRWLVGLAGEAQCSDRERHSECPELRSGLGEGRGSQTARLHSSCGIPCHPKTVAELAGPAKRWVHRCPAPRAPYSTSFSPAALRPAGAPAHRSRDARTAEEPLWGHPGGAGRVASSPGPASRNGQSRCSHLEPQRCGRLPVTPGPPSPAARGALGWGVGKSLARGRSSRFSDRFPEV